MLITENFVVLHQPKTGGTFVSDALLRIHGVVCNVRKIGKSTNLAFETPYGEFIVRGPKHNTGCDEIPEGHKRKTVLTTVRNPYDRYVSLYEFGWWKKEEYLDWYRKSMPDLDQRYPAFPDIDFTDYLRFANRREIAAGTDIGIQTVGFIERYFKDAKRVLAELDEDYFSSGRYRADMFDVHFLQTDRLNRDLHEFLLAVGYPAAEIAFILELEKVVPKAPPEGRSREGRSWKSYYSAQSLEFVRHRERHLLALFPDFELSAASVRQKSRQTGS
ncbi:MAG: sulfotransferase family 2 domain-containing protein [Gemmatimonadaceae bacterium]|nr:sulfotransferase family 2 domain-containing protein [Gemmatimonadaceae bacterium]